MARSVLITGASQGGIGDHLSQEFHKRGFQVFATARSLSKVEHLKKLGITTIELDVTSLESIKAAVKVVAVASGSRLDVLVNNSGVVYSIPVLDTDISVAKDMFEVNYFGVLRVTQEFSPLVIAAKGSIINMSSITGEFPNPYTSSYNASKAALSSLTDSIRLELSPFGVNVTTVRNSTPRALRRRALTLRYRSLRAPWPQILCRIGSRLSSLRVSGPWSQIFEKEAANYATDSLYLPVKAKIQYIMDGSELKAGAMDPAQFARRVVDNALKSNPEARLWYGTSSGLIWFMTTFFKHTFLASSPL
ncbi:NADPH-dependent 1-acyldihydroxyacetone phosphate reductase [Trichoderma lentiforme]|uniref:NADPH-dependent 1-acyldihydroxyacetone phosphate reductase n=1 Tax=Trichoderma lentiforme TaxID=1567552 RepID=A0A9P4X9N0_9HYPO|nr:NADPH-dependent 1-acyldihydroxyacetone phosphate reductase [Trichoderma lentiforme]